VGITRAATECFSCHESDYRRAARRSIDHAAAGFSIDCRQCHEPWRFFPASFPEHDACFAIGRGPHRGIACRDCHVTGVTASAAGTCSTNNAACSACHAHTCAEMAGEHDEVQGFECRDRKCYECHMFTAR
jgi:hypothetical protein